LGSIQLRSLKTYDKSFHCKMEQFSQRWQREMRALRTAVKKWN